MRSRFVFGVSEVTPDLLKPRARSVSWHRWESRSTRRSSSVKERDSYCREHGSCTSSTTSARANPYADKTPLYLREGERGTEEERRRDRDRKRVVQVIRRDVSMLT